MTERFATSLRAELIVLDEARVQEEFFDRGWTDGLPVIAPTLERVDKMLAYAGTDDPDTMIGFVSALNRGVSVRMAAVNAVMAGCRPDYLPIVLATLEAMFDPAFNLRAVITSTGGLAQSIVVSGAIADEIGMNARHNALGPGNRANATIGRSIRLVIMNLLGALPGSTDASTLGHPGKYTACFAEDTPPPPWQPLRAVLGYDDADTTVTVVPTEGVRQIAQQHNGSGEALLRTIASAIRAPSNLGTGRGGAGLVVLGPEHAGLLISEGWSQRDVGAFLHSHSMVTPEELAAAGVLLDRAGPHQAQPDADGRLPSLMSPDDLYVVTAGGAGGGWSAYASSYGGFRAVSRRVRPSGEALPDCGPDGCVVPWAAA